jgi:hypothetical protein
LKALVKPFPGFAWNHGFWSIPSASIVLDATHDNAHRGGTQSQAD